MKNKRNSKILTLFLCLIVIWGGVLTLTACAKSSVDTVKIMAVDGIGYTVEGEKIKEVERGALVEFGIKILDGYAVKGVSQGVFDGAKVSVEKVEFDCTIYIDCQKISNLKVEKTNCSVNIAMVDKKDKYFVGDKVEISVVADNEHYLLDKFSVNGVEVLLEKENAQKGMCVIELQESMYVVATALGEELNVVVEDTYHGQIKFKNNASVSEEVLVEGQPKTCRYGDLLDVTFTPNAGYNYAYGYINGDLVEGQKATKKVINHVYITGQFFNNTTRYINIDSNGGVGNGGASFYCKQYFNEEKRFETLDEYTKPNDLYINLHDYSTMMKRDGYKLVGFNTFDEHGKVNDTFRLRGLVANIYPWQKPGEMQTLKAIWEKETPETIAENGNQSPVFLYEESGGNIILKGLTAQGRAWLADPANKGKIVIPEIIAGKKVVAIADNAFEGYNDLKEIILAKNIERVGNFAFKNCQNITTFWFTDSVIQIDDNIFIGCPKITTMKLNNYIKRIWKRTNLGNFSEKMMWYKIQTKPTIVTVAGSSMLFGMDSKEVSMQFNGYAYANLGINAGLCANMFFDIMANLIKEKDIVIYAPEYESEIMNIFENNFTELYRCLFEGDSIWIEQINYLKYKKILKTINDENYWRNSYVSNDIKLIDSFAYDPRYYSKHGEVKVFRQGDYVFGRYTIINSDNLNNSFKKGINDFNKQILLKKAKLYYSFPPVDTTAITAETNTRENKFLFCQTLEDALKPMGIPIISDINKYILPHKYFWDSPYHLNSEGATLRTKQLCADIIDQLIKEGVIVP